MTINKKVSIVITAYNREDMIIRAIQSVIGQTYQNIEIIIVDDCSTDNTQQVLNSFLNELKYDNIHYLRNERNKGANFSRNRGIEASTGEYISFLDDDDEYFPTKIEEQVQYMNEYKGSIIYCGLALYSNGRFIQNTNLKHEGDLHSKLLVYNFIGNPSALLLEKKILIEYGFDNDLPACQDWDIITRLAKDYKFFNTKSVLVKINIQEENSISTGKKLSDGYLMYYKKHIKSYGFFKVIEALIFYLLVGLKNRRFFELKKIYYLVSSYFQQKNYK
ncbi:MAG: glycosyltransferase family 2 protein [Campylobacterota bacterium]|nr:glycosyltransferase family 2 protein [Campylobacterota bacterium]